MGYTRICFSPEMNGKKANKAKQKINNKKAKRKRLRDIRTK